MATALAAMLFDPVMKGFKNELTVMGKIERRTCLRESGMALDRSVEAS